ncbi:MAG: hypothetical protein ABW252_10345 [Polyangiales bacterium]
MTRLAALGCTALAALAGVAELIAVQAALADAVAPALALHTACAVLVGCCVLVTLAHAGRTDASAALGASLFTLCAPAVGAVAVIAIGLPAFRRGVRRRSFARVVERPMPRFTDDTLEGMRAAGGASRPALAPDRLLEQRVAATKALRHMESARAVPLLRRALSDPSEDVRLLAHAILDRRERLLRGAIDVLRDSLARLTEQPTEPRVVARVHAQLADHYWELCYSAFATGDGAVLALRQAAEHAEAASTATATRGAALVAVRAYLRLGALDDAAAAIERAAHTGLTSAQLAPLRAELAFLTRRFGPVGATLRALPPLSRQRAQLGDVARFWSERRRS